MATIHFEVVGRVQRVGFRWFVRQRARALGLRGWVRNLESGGVEVAAEGTDSDLAALVQAVEQGPAGALVEHVMHRTPQPGRDYPDPFKIL